jgi:hypothetical protein
MRIIGAAALFMTLVLGVAMAQNTPPGADQVGSDKHVGTGGLETRPTNDPEVNQRVTNTMGSSTGQAQTPVFAGSGSGNPSNTETPSAAGQSRETGVAAARRSDAKRVQARAGAKAGDNGSVWQSKTKRQSNVVGSATGQQNTSVPKRSTTNGSKSSQQQ